MRSLVVDQVSVWSLRKSASVAAMVGASSVLGLWMISQVNEMLQYELSDWIFFPVFVASGIVLPVGALIYFCKRIPTPVVALCYLLGFAISWHATFWILQTAEFGLWKGFVPGERTMANVLARQVKYFGIEAAAIMIPGMAVWGLCRLVHGKTTFQQHPTCRTCSYNLTGNASGVCPECGSPTNQATDVANT